MATASTRGKKPPAPDAEISEEEKEAQAARPVVPAREVDADYVVPEDTGPRVPGLADIVNAAGAGDGVAAALDENIKNPEDAERRSAEWSDRGQEYHTGPEQPKVEKG